MNRNSTAVCGHGADRRPRGADIRDLGKGGTALTARPLTARPLTALGGVGGGRRSDHHSAVRDCWLDSPLRHGNASRYGRTHAHPLPTHRHEDEIPANSTRAAPLGQVTIFSFEGAESGHRRTEQFARTGEFGPDLPY